MIPNGYRSEPDFFAILQDTARFLWKDWPNLELSNIRGDGGFTLNGVCPHCGAKATFPTVAQVYEDRSREPYIRLIGVARCIACNDYILARLNNSYIARSGYTRWVYEAHYPLGKPNDSVAVEVPEHIALDFKEAKRRLWVSAYNAAAEMCRRALEASCLDLGASKNKVLQKMIDSLEEKRVITPALKDAAHKIRLGEIVERTHLKMGHHPKRPIRWPRKISNE